MKTNKNNFKPDAIVKSGTGIRYPFSKEAPVRYSFNRFVEIFDIKENIIGVPHKLHELLNIPEHYFPVDKQQVIFYPAANEIEIVFTSFSDACRTHSIPIGKARDRLNKMNWTLEETLEINKRNARPYQYKTLVDSKSYPSQNAAAQSRGVNIHTFRNRKLRGHTNKEAIKLELEKRKRANPYRIPFMIGKVCFTDIENLRDELSIPNSYDNRKLRLMLIDRPYNGKSIGELMDIAIPIKFEDEEPALLLRLSAKFKNLLPRFKNKKAFSTAVWNDHKTKQYRLSFRSEIPFVIGDSIYTNVEEVRSQTTIPHSFDDKKLKLMLVEKPFNGKQINELTSKAPDLKLETNTLAILQMVKEKYKDLLPTFSNIERFEFEVLHEHIRRNYRINPKLQNNLKEKK